MSCPTSSRPSVVRFGRKPSVGAQRGGQAREARRQHGRQAGRQLRPSGARDKGQEPDAQYVELARQTTDRSSSSSRSSATSVTRATPTRTPTRRPPARLASTARCATRSPSPTAPWTTPRSGSRLQPRRTSGRPYFGSAGVESLKTYYETQSSGQFSVSGTVTNWVKVRYNEARYGRSNGFPCAGIVCSNTWELVRDAANQWYADQIAAGRTPSRGQRRARDLRQVGPLRLRRRRQLQRARRLHRPLPDRARRRRPGRRRPAPGRGRDLEPPLVRLPEAHLRSSRPTSSGAPRSAPPDLDR